MAAMGPYDSSLQMFVQTPREPDMTRLSFLKWLVDQRRLVGDTDTEIRPASSNGENARLPISRAFPVTAEGAPRFTGISEFPDGVQPGVFEGCQFMRRK